MSVKKNRRKKSSQPNSALLVFSLIIVGLIFTYSLIVLSDPNTNELEPEIQRETVTKDQFIERIRPHAQELQASYGVLPSIIIGQAILESNWGQSQLAEKYNNLFGIKAYGDQPKINLETKEYVNEEWITIQGDFRVYNTWEESMNDHTKLFVNGVTWNPQLYQNVLLARNYKEAAQALQQAGYATDPTYADKVIHVIETYELNQYDN